MTRRPTVLFVLGTRPEAVKLAPVVHAARAHDDWRVRVCSTGQHRELLAPFLATFELAPDIELATMIAGQSLADLLAGVLTGVQSVLATERPDWLVVQGDTTTVLGASLAAASVGIPVAHVEAGLRTHDRTAPFPEEMNRVLVGRIAALHLCPTARARANLLCEGTDPRELELTGNTVVDAVRWILARLPGPAQRPAGLPAELHLREGAPLVLVTGHRRESFDGGLASVCTALRDLARAHPEIDIVYPVHLNPRVQEVRTMLADAANIQLCAPVDYPSAIWLLRRCRFVITDSGGIQEEAPELGKPVLVTRVATERPEAAERGMAIVVGYDAAAITQWASRWLDDDASWRRASPSHNPFGDGSAGLRCVAALRARLGLPTGDAIPPWAG
jgi:UDP-N-acetylglucosamine 2-epimerase (non-hydrolysing)